MKSTGRAYALTILSGLLVWAVSCKQQTRPTPVSSPAQTNILTQEPAPFSVLHEELLNLLSQAKGQYSVYLEDLTTGQTLQIQPDKLYPAWSLLKLIVLSTILNKVDQGHLSLEQTMDTPEPDQSSPPQFIKIQDPSESPTLRELLERLICYSDNAASFELAKLFRAETFQQNLECMGLPQTAPGKPRNTLPDISARQFAQALHTLYLANYLSPELSEFALELMSTSVYDSQIITGLPAGTPAAHMVGFNADHGDFHDCGIVYLPGHPYILCVMSSHNTREEADEIIHKISNIVFQYITQQI